MSTLAAGTPTEPTLHPRFEQWLPRLVGLFLVALGTLLVYLLLPIWPAIHAATEGRPPVRIAWFGWHYTPSADTAYLILVILSSALGSYVHAATSFADFVGNRRFRSSWLWWYVLRGFIGIALAIVFYFTLRGGFLATGTTEDLDPYGVAALAALVGLFSKQATDKLREIFDTAFHVREGLGDQARGDSLDPEDSA